MMVQKTIFWIVATVFNGACSVYNLHEAQFSKKVQSWGISNCENYKILKIKLDICNEPQNQA